MAFEVPTRFKGDPRDMPAEAWVDVVRWILGKANGGLQQAINVATMMGEGQTLSKDQLMDILLQARREQREVQALAAWAADAFAKLKEGK
jgi:hypothetical protein